MELNGLADITLPVNTAVTPLRGVEIRRHEHEYHVGEHVTLPEGKVLIPGVATHTTNLTGGSDLVVEWIVQFANIV